MDFYNQFRKIVQHISPSDSSTSTWAGGDSTTTISIDFYSNYDNEKNAEERRGAKNGECTLILYLDPGVNTSVVVSGKNIYGSDKEQTAWEILASTAITTAGYTIVKQLQISNPDDFDPNATGIELTLQKLDSTAIEYRYRIIRG